MLKTFKLAALRARLPVLAPAEKSALAILLSLLASGAALRAWENSGVAFGPVDDWKTLRAWVVRSRAADATPWPCAAEEGRGASGGFQQAGFGAGGKKGSSAKASGGKKVPKGLV